MQTPLSFRAMSHYCTFILGHLARVYTLPPTGFTTAQLFVYGFGAEARERSLM